MDFSILIWLLPAFLFTHEMEEWNILSWYERNYINLPRKTNTSIRTFLIFISLFGFAWIFLATRFTSQRTSAMLISLFAAVILMNAIQHIYWTFLYRQYAPGVITSVVLLIPVILAIYFRFVAEEILSWGILILVNLPILAIGLSQTFRAKNELTAMFNIITRFGVWLATLLRLEKA
jgi:hypothetical protein